MKLQPRERMVLMLGAIGVVAIGAYGISQGPYQTYVHSKEQLTQAKENLKDAKIRQATVRRDQEKQKQTLSAVSTAGKFNLWTEVDKAVKDLKLGTRCSVATKRGPQASGIQNSTVDVTLNGVSSKELVDFLHRVYDTGSFVYVSQVLYIRPTPDQKSLECKLTFVAPQA